MLLHVDGNYFRLHKQGIKDEILVGQYLDSLTDHKTSSLDLFQLNFWIVAGKSNREENCIRFFTWTPQLGMANAWPSQCYPNATVLYCSIIRILVFGYPSLRCHSSVKASQFNSPQYLSYVVRHSCCQHLSILLPDEAVSGTTLAYCLKAISRGNHSSSCGLQDSLYDSNSVFWHTQRVDDYLHLSLIDNYHLLWYIVKKY